MTTSKKTSKTAFLGRAGATTSLGLRPRLESGPSIHHLAASALLTLSAHERDAYERVRRQVSSRHVALLAGLLLNGRLQERDLSPQAHTLLEHLEVLAHCRLNNRLERAMLLNQALRLIAGQALDLRDEFHRERQFLMRAEVLATIATHARTTAGTAPLDTINASEFIRVLVGLLSPGVVSPPRPAAQARKFSWPWQRAKAA